MFELRGVCLSCVVCILAALCACVQAKWCMPELRGVCLNCMVRVSAALCALVQSG